MNIHAVIFETIFSFVLTIIILGFLILLDTVCLKELVEDIIKNNKGYFRTHFMIPGFYLTMLFFNVALISIIYTLWSHIGK